MTKDEAEEEFPCEGLKELGDFMYAGHRVRLRCKDNETEYYVLSGSGLDIQTFTFDNLTHARSFFTKQVENLIFMVSGSDVSIYMQQKANYVKGSRRKFAKKK